MDLNSRFWKWTSTLVFKSGSLPPSHLCHSCSNGHILLGWSLLHAGFTTGWDCWWLFPSSILYSIYSTMAGSQWEGSLILMKILMERHYFFYKNHFIFKAEKKSATQIWKLAILKQLANCKLTNPAIFLSLSLIGELCRNDQVQFKDAFCLLQFLNVVWGL